MTLENGRDPVEPGARRRARTRPDRPRRAAPRPRSRRRPCAPAPPIRRAPERPDPRSPRFFPFIPHGHGRPPLHREYAKGDPQGKAVGVGRRGPRRSDSARNRRRLGVISSARAAVARHDGHPPGPNAAAPVHLGRDRGLPRRARTTIVIPIGSNEQHGPTGLLGTDWLCPEIIAHEAQKDADILVAPTFNIGMAQHHLDFPGTIALRPSTFMAAIGDWTRSLAHHGFEQDLFPQRPRRQRRHHRGGVLRALRRGELRRPAAPASPAGSAQLVGPERACCKLAQQQFPAGHGSHATPSEIAVTQWAYPDTIKAANYAPQIAPTGPIREARRLPRPPPRRPHGLRPGPGDAGKGRRAGAPGGGGPDPGRGRILRRAFAGRAGGRMTHATLGARLAPLPAQPRNVPWPTAEWPMGAPEADPAVLDALLAEAFEGDPAGPLGETHAVVVIQGGRLVLERYGPDYGPDVTYRSWSMAKSITQALVGIAGRRRRARHPRAGRRSRVARPGRPAAARSRSITCCACPAAWPSSRTMSPSTPPT